MLKKISIDENLFYIYKTLLSFYSVSISDSDVKEKISDLISLLEDKIYGKDFSFDTECLNDIEKIVTFQEITFNDSF